MVGFPRAPKNFLFDHQKTLTIKFLFFFFGRVEILTKKIFLRGAETLTQGKTHWGTELLQSKIILSFL